MKKPSIIFWKDSVMKCREFVEELCKEYGKSKCTLEACEQDSFIGCACELLVQAACLAALPVAEESKEKVEDLIQTKINFETDGSAPWILDQTEEYQIKAEWREEYQMITRPRYPSGDATSENEIVLVLVD